MRSLVYHDLFSQKALKDWGLFTETEPIMINSNILPTSEINVTNGHTQAAYDKTLRNFSIQEPSAERNGHNLREEALKIG